MMFRLNQSFDISAPTNGAKIDEQTPPTRERQCKDN